MPVILTVIAASVNILHAQAPLRFSEDVQQRYAERIAVTKQLEEYAKKNFSIDDILKDVAFIHYKRSEKEKLAREQRDIAKERREMEQRKDPITGIISVPLITVSLEKKYIIEQETNKLLAESQKQLANIFRFYPNIPVNDIANDAKRIENQNPKNAFNPEIKIDSNTTILLTFEFIKDFCAREARKRPSRYIPGQVPRR